MKKIITLLLIFYCFNLIAQQNISGRVITDVGGVPYVNVYIKNTTNGTITNNKGEYSINNTQPLDTLRFSMIGYQPIDTIIKVGIENINIKLVEARINLPEIEITAQTAESIIKSIKENLSQNYPTKPTAFSAIFRKQVLENNTYLFLGNANINILYPTYVLNANNKENTNERKIFLNDIRLTNNNLKEINFSISPSGLVDFYPQYGFIVNPQYFNYAFKKSLFWNGETYLKIGFKTKDKFWKDLPVEGVITVAKSSYAITEIEYQTFRAPEKKRGYSKEKKIYNGTFVTNEYTNHIFYKKQQDNKWYFSYSKVYWDVDVKYKKYPQDNRNFILQSDLLAGESIEPEHITGTIININIDIFDKQKVIKPSNWEKLNPILPDFSESINGN